MKKISAVLLLILLFVCALGFSACSSPSAQNNNGTEPPEKTETIKYLVTVVDGVGGGEFEKGASVTVIADVKSDKTFVGWSDGENIISNDLTYTFVLKGNITLFATYKDNASVTEYKVIVKTDGIHSETFIVEKGDSISLIAQNKAGYAFEKWIDGNGAFVSSKSVATYYPTKDITIIAQYKMVYSVNVVNGTVAGQSANNQYKEGTKLTISANQVDGKYFAGWYIDSVLVSENNPYIFEVTENVIITAMYEDIQVEKTYYTVVVYADGVTATQTTIEENKQCTVQANAPEGKKFVGWYVNSVLLSENNPHVFTVTKDVEIRAEFEDLPPETVYYTIAIYKDGVTPSSIIVAENEQFVLSAEVPDGYRFVKWIDSDGNTVATTQQATMTAVKDETYTAVFVKQCVVLVTGGTGSGTYDVNSSVTVVATVDVGKKFVAWKNSSGDVLSTNATYTFTVATDITLIAETERDEWTEILP